MTDKPYSKYYKMSLGELCREAGFREESADKAEQTISMLVSLGMMREQWSSDGMGFDIWSALSALADLRSKLPIQPGMRVEVREDRLDRLVEHWGRYGEEVMRETFSFPGTVISVDYNSVWGTWAATVDFDYEFHRTFGSSGALTVSTGENYWPVNIESLEPEHV